MELIAPLWVRVPPAVLLIQQNKSNDYSHRKRKRNPTGNHQLL
jgi:hypothetical protein